MDKITRIALIKEFEKYLSDNYPNMWEKEVMFNKLIDTKRRFRADYVITSHHLISDIVIEINGGQWVNGRHNRGGQGYQNDLTKFNLAQLNGIKVFQFTYEMLLSKEYEYYF
jgi:hypothetical protein